jgi:hypothetical protein
MLVANRLEESNKMRSRNTTITIIYSVDQYFLLYAETDIPDGSTYSHILLFSLADQVPEH